MSYLRRKKLGFRFQVHLDDLLPFDFDEQEYDSFYEPFPFSQLEEEARLEEERLKREEKENNELIGLEPEGELELKRKEEQRV